MKDKRGYRTVFSLVQNLNFHRINWKTIIINMKIFQQYDQIKVEDVGSSSETESESESEAIVPSGMLPFC